MATRVMDKGVNDKDLYFWKSFVNVEHVCQILLEIVKIADSNHALNLIIGDETKNRKEYFKSQSLACPPMTLFEFRVQP